MFLSHIAVFDAFDEIPVTSCEISAEFDLDSHWANSPSGGP